MFSPKQGWPATGPPILPNRSTFWDGYLNEPRTCGDLGWPATGPQAIDRS